LRRCSDSATAEDLIAETFLAAVAVVHNEVQTELSIPWLIGVARHKLVDHWRRQERQQRMLVLITDGMERSMILGALNSMRPAPTWCWLNWDHITSLR